MIGCFSKVDIVPAYPTWKCLSTSYDVVVMLYNLSSFNYALCAECVGTIRFASLLYDQ